MALNRSARHKYDLGERLEAGIRLQGWEVKSLRAGQVNLRDSHVIIRQGEAFVMGLTITPLATANKAPPPDPTRSRKLLLHRSELIKLGNAVKAKQHTMVPTAIYWKKGMAKLEIALAKGKKQHDKRAAIKEAEWQRQQQRAMKNARLQSK